MALITMPTSPNFSQSRWSIRRAVASAKSPFTGHEQVYAYDIACWQATLSLPAMKRSQAGAWQSFFLKLKGRANTFLIGDPDGASQEGTATTCTLTSAASIGESTISATINGSIKAGDYIQFGSSSTSQLHMVVADASQGTGVTLTIEPELKVAVSTGAATIVDAKCVMRMDSNDLGWDADHVSKYGFSFSCTEAI